MGGNLSAVAAAETAPLEEPWQEADGSASGVDGNPLCPEEREPSVVVFCLGYSRKVLSWE